MHTFTRYDDIRTVLSDPAFTVPSVPAGGPSAGIAWLRAHVARFSNGPDHRRRRALATGVLAATSPRRLRRRAARHTAAQLARRSVDGQPVDLMASVARVVPVVSLAEAMGVQGVSAESVATVARAYHPHARDTDTADTDTADRAVARLVDACGGAPDEETAARIGLLVQAYDATAGLVGNAVLAMLPQSARDPVETIVSDTLRRDPPVLRTRRVAGTASRVGGVELAAGTPVHLELSLASGDDDHLAFGFGDHACPGRKLAVALAAGILDELDGWRLAESPSTSIEYEPISNVRVPAAVWMS